jgi:hypothetical protein
MIDIERSENQKVLQYVTQGEPIPRSSLMSLILVRSVRALDSFFRLFRKPAARIAQAADHFNGCYGHPEFMDRFWQLGASLPAECRMVLYGRKPAFVHPRTGVIFGLLGGLEYYLRLPPQLIGPALAAGGKTTNPGRSWTDTKRDLGDDWIIAPWGPEEVSWIQAAYEWFGNEQNLA